MLVLPEKQSIDHPAGRFPCVVVVAFSPAPGREGFVCPAAQRRIKQLVNGYQYLLHLHVLIVSTRPLIEWRECSTAVPRGDSSRY